MEHQILFIFKKYHHNVLTVSFLFATLVVEVLSVNSKSSACLPRNCGKGPNISYPFWIPIYQESFCGSPEFNVSCNDEYPTLVISDDDYIIKDIFYANNSFLLVKSEVYKDDGDENDDNNGKYNKCPVPMHNVSIAGTSFSYSSATTDLFFFYNCTKPYDKETYPIDCASNDTRHAFAVFHPQLFKHWNYSTELCQASVNAPVETDDITRLLEMNFTDILRKGFVLEWDSVYCSKCRKSGGGCGSYNNEFICFCNDQPHRRSCDDGAGLNVNLKILIGIGAATLSAILMSMIFFIYLRQNKKRNEASVLNSRDVSSYSSSITDLEKAGKYHGLYIFTYSELDEATNHFDIEKELGDGGFGTVYQGKLIDGRIVAVKRLFENNYKMVGQFMNEVEILTRLRHQNLVTLYGCTSHHSRELILVYEYVPNGTVADHLHGERAKPGSLTWSTRLNIAIETANALAFLHASDVIHRDVKTNNILLDKNFGVKVADFGLSRLFPTNVTHVSTAPQGTPGYVDPEYHECYQLTDKSDVYSFGVVLIELISSKHAVDISRHRHEINLSNMAINKIQNHALHELVDPFLGFESNCLVSEMISDVAELAFQCLQNGKEMRPSMEKVLEILKGIQNKGYDIPKAGEVDTLAHDVALLKD